MQRGWSSASGATILLGLLFLGPIQVLLLTCGMTVEESCPSGPNWPALAIGVAFVALGVSAIVSKTNRRRPPRRPGSLPLARLRGKITGSHADPIDG